MDPTGSDESGHSGSSGGGIVIQTAGDPTEGHQAGGLTVLSPGATPPHGLSVRPHKTSVHGRPRAIRQIEQGMGPTPVATGAGTKLRDTAMTATLKSMEGIRADALREAQSVEHYCLLVVMASKRSQLPSAYYTRELQLLFDKVFAGIPME